MDSFYSDFSVRLRLLEFLGAEELSGATAVYVTHSDGCLFAQSELITPAQIDQLLDRELDVARSLADRESVLFHLDVEYVNFDAPAEAYVDP